MPLRGELEHVPIVDVIQLIHSTRKSGTLNVFSRKGEGKLIFNDGYIVSASHSQEQIKIGKILLENQLITQDDLDKALTLQDEIADVRKPLIAILLNISKISKEKAFKALETLIEMTIVEMLSWTNGVFTFDIKEPSVPDEYRYLPQSLQSLTLDTQMVLMDALRIFDEKVYSGEIAIDEEPLDDETRQKLLADSEEEKAPSVDLSDDILGLADLDKLDRKIPEVFKSLDDFSSDNLQREINEKATESLSGANKEKVTDFLSQLATERKKTHYSVHNQTVILFATSPLLEQALSTVCKHEGRFVFIAQDETELETLIGQAVSRQLKPLVIFPAPDEKTPETEMQLIRSRINTKFLNLDILQLASTTQLNFQLQAWQEGLFAVLPLPKNEDINPQFADEFIHVLRTFQFILSEKSSDSSLFDLRNLTTTFSHLRSFRSVPALSREILLFVSKFFDRTITFVINRSDFIAERSVGILNSKELSAPLKWKLSLPEDSRLWQLLDMNECYNGENPDDDFTAQLYTQIDQPAANNCLLLPLRCNQRAIMLIYADNGDQPVKKIDKDFFDAFIEQAGLVLENALYRKQLAS